MYPIIKVYKLFIHMNLEQDQGTIGLANPTKVG